MQSEWAQRIANEPADHGCLNPRRRPKLRQRPYNTVPDEREHLAVGLVDRREQCRQPLIQLNMPPPRQDGYVERSIEIIRLLQTTRESPCVQESHIGTLSKLGTGRMPGIANVDQRAFNRRSKRSVGVAGKG